MVQTQKNTSPTRLVVTPGARERKKTDQVVARARELDVPVTSGKIPDQQTAKATPNRQLQNQLFLTARPRSYINRWSQPEVLPDPDEFCLTPIEGCLFNCCYCYLHDYLDHNLTIATVNYDKIHKQLEDALSAAENRLFSLGEVSDGLHLEHLLGYLPVIWKLFRNNPGARLEVRTKSNRVGSVLKRLSPLENVTFTWTLSPPDSARRLELHTPGPEARLEAMSRLLGAGFRCGLRLDPVVLEPGWEKKYEELLDITDSYIDLDELAFVVVGTFRFPPGLDEVIAERFPHHDFIRDEFVRGPDGKFRYPRRRRTRAYRKIYRLLASHDVRPSLSMEPDYIRKDSGYET